MKKEKNEQEIITELPKAVRAYDDKEFVHSDDGRVIRLIAEYTGPQSRFEKYHIDKFILFFGSARIMSKDKFGDKMEFLESKLQVSNDEQKTVINAEIKKLKDFEETTNYYEDAVDLAKMLSEWSSGLTPSKRFVICSGGGPGIMEAANKGAFLAGARSVGLNISLPFEQNPNPYISPEFNLEFHYFFMRKFWFTNFARAIVVFPGGYGTMDEFWEMLTLIQTKKVKLDIPIVLYGEKFWNKVINFEYLVEMGLISRADLDLFKFANTPNEAYDYIKGELTRIYKLDK